MVMAMAKIDHKAKQVILEFVMYLPSTLLIFCSNLQVEKQIVDQYNLCILEQDFKRFVMTLMKLD